MMFPTEERGCQDQLRWMDEWIVLKSTTVTKYIDTGGGGIQRGGNRRDIYVRLARSSGLSGLWTLSHSTVSLVY